MANYTVIGHYESDGAVFVYPQEATGPHHAIALASETMLRIADLDLVILGDGNGRVHAGL